MDFFREGGSEKHLRDIAGILKISGDALGSMERVSWEGQGERLAASFIAKDIAVGLPALVDYLCARGVESVSYTITDYSASLLSKTGF